MLHSHSLDRIEAGLYVLATPIGNLRDITLRALDVLAGADLIAAEDTRVTRHLLTHYGINAKIVSLREHNETREAPRIIEQIRQGQAVVLVTDAGTPGISDPGAILVNAARAAGVSVWPIPGPCAAVCALSASGFDAQTFSFHGFLPPKAGERRKAMEALKSLTGLQILYEAPHRIEDTLRDLVAVLGGERPCALFRELTKKFEESKFGSLAQVLAWLGEGEHRDRGEFVIVIQGAEQVERSVAIGTERILALLCEHLPTKDAARIAAEITGEKRNLLYELALNYKVPKTSDSGPHD